MQSNFVGVTNAVITRQNYNTCITLYIHFPHINSHSALTLRSHRKSFIYTLLEARNQATGFVIQHNSVPVLIQDKLGGLWQEGHPA